MKKKKSMSGIFFSMFLRTVVIILAVVIVALGAALVKQSLSKSRENKMGTSSEIDESVLTESDGEDELLGATEEGQADGQDDGTDTPSAALSTDKKIVVLNGTATKGLAGHWKDQLAGYGYTNIDAHNYYSRLENTKILVTEEGIGEDLKQYFPNADYEVGTLTSDETDANIDGVQIFVIIGTSDDVLSQ